MNCRPLLLLVLMVATGSSWAAAPTQRERWNEPQQPFRVFGNTWWVGTRGIGVVLVTSPQGHILIDGGLPESVPQVLANIRTAGFDIRDVRLIVNSHVHVDHAGGLAELQRLSGARIVASAWSANVLRNGKAAVDDPQRGQLDEIASVAVADTVTDGSQEKVGPLTITAHLTPGHTPGGTSWSWQSCEAARCVNVVFADSLNAASTRGFRFSDNGLPATFGKSFTTLASLPCDVLLAAHPAPAQVFEKLAAREAGKADAFIDTGACGNYVDAARKFLDVRLESEQRN